MSYSSRGEARCSLSWLGPVILRPGGVAAEVNGPSLSLHLDQVAVIMTQSIILHFESENWTRCDYCPTAVYFCAGVNLLLITSVSEKWC